MVQYLHFRILKFPWIWEDFPRCFDTVGLCAALFKGMCAESFSFFRSQCDAPGHWEDPTCNATRWLHPRNYELRWSLRRFWSLCLWLRCFWIIAACSKISHRFGLELWPARTWQQLAFWSLEILYSSSKWVTYLGIVLGCPIWPFRLHRLHRNVFYGWRSPAWTV